MISGPYEHSDAAACINNKLRNRGMIAQHNIEQHAAVTVRKPNVDRAKLDALIANDDKFSATWEHKRTDLQDQSGSGYDQALANQAAMAKWSAQEIVDLLVSFADKHGLKHKAEEYYKRTVGKALGWAKSHDNPRQQIAALYGLNGDATRDERLALASQLLGLDPPIENIVKVLGQPITWKLYWSGQSVDLGSSMLNQDSFRNNLANIANRVTPRRKDAEWQRVAQLLIDAADVIDPGSDAYILSAVRDRIPQYIEQRLIGGLTNPDEGDDSWKDAAILGQPFVRDGKIHISLDGRKEGFVSWFQESYIDGVSAKQLRVCFREIGFTYRRTSLRHQDRVISSGTWAMPISEFVGSTQSANTPSPDTM